MRRRCIPIPNGILCTSGEPSPEDLAAVADLLKTVKQAAAAKRANLGPKNWGLVWQRVHSGDPKRHRYRDALKAATGADRVADMAFTPSGLLLSGSCSRVVNSAGLIQNLGYFQILTP